MLFLERKIPCKSKGFKNDPPGGVLAGGARWFQVKEELASVPAVS